MSDEERSTTEPYDERAAIAEVIRGLTAGLAQLSSPASFIDRSLTFVWINQAGADFWGLAVSDIVGRPIASIVSEERRIAVLAELRGVIETGRPAPVVTAQSRTRSGRTRRYRSERVPVFDRGGRVLGVLSIFIGLTPIEETEEALRESRANLSAIIENVPDAIWSIDREYRHIVSNSVLKRMIQREAGRYARPGERGLQLLREDGATFVKGCYDRALAGEQVVTEYVDGEGEGRRYFEMSYNPIVTDGAITGVAVVSRDVTEARRMQQALAVTERLASLGTLAAGVAHEINNPLAFMMTSLEILDAETSALGALPPTSLGTIRRAVDELREGTERIRRIVRELGAFSREDDEAASAVDVGRVLESALRMSAHEIGRRARVVKEIDEHLPRTRAPESKLAQVFLNLLINAAQAIPEGSRAEHEVRIRARADAAGWICVEVADTGAGIPDDVRDRIFDPFFTTKPVGVGTGLGLSITHRILTSIGGGISFDSVVGRGTTFRVRLPPAPEAEPASSLKPPVEAPSAAGARVLIVDDEPAILFGLSRMLKRFEVVTAATGREAIERLATERFDVVLCDLMMPDLTGMAIYDAVRARTPGLERRMIFMTGGTSMPVVVDFLERIPNRRVEKPFSTASLQRAVHDLLAELGPAG